MTDDSGRGEGAERSAARPVRLLKPPADESLGMPDHVRRDDDVAARGGSGRYGHNPGSGANQDDKGEKKDERGFVSRQGGGQSRVPGRKDKDAERHDRG